MTGVIFALGYKADRYIEMVRPFQRCSSFQQRIYSYCFKYKKYTTMLQSGYRCLGPAWRWSRLSMSHLPHRIPSNPTRLFLASTLFLSSVQEYENPELGILFHNAPLAHLDETHTTTLPQRILRILNQYIVEPIFIFFRGISLFVILSPIVLCSPLIFWGTVDPRRDYEPKGRLWWYALVRKQLERAGPTFIKVSHVCVASSYFCQYLVGSVGSDTRRFISFPILS